MLPLTVRPIRGSWPERLQLLLQRAGRAAQDTGEFLRGMAWPRGTLLE